MIVYTDKSGSQSAGRGCGGCCDPEDIEDGVSDHVADHVEDEAHGELRDSVGVLTWAVSNVDALGGAVSEVNCVVASACTHNKLQVLIGIDDGCGDLGRANDQNLRLHLSELGGERITSKGGVVCDFDACTLHFLHTSGGELISDENFHL